MNRALSITNLLIVLLSGVLLRYQWTWPAHAVFDSRFLIHAHSHLALLGWLFPMLLDRFKPNAFHNVWVATYHATVWAMSVAFLLQGYAFWSITLSTIVMMGGSIAAIRVFDTTGLVGKAALVLMWISNLGPMALSAGAFMGPDWIRGWVTFYLHVQFSGWITLAVLAAKPVARPLVPLTLLVLGAVLLLEPYFRTATTPIWIQFVGLTGGLSTLLGTLLWLKQIVHRDVTDAAFLLKGGLQLIASIPVYGTSFLSNHAYAIGFAHLVLVAMATHRLLPVQRSGLFLIGIWSMVAALILQGFGADLGLMLLPHPQFIFFITGVVTLTGALLRLLPFLSTIIQNKPS